MLLVPSVGLFIFLTLNINGMNGSGMCEWAFWCWLELENFSTLTSKIWHLNCTTLFKIEFILLKLPYIEFVVPLVIIVLVTIIGFVFCYLRIIESKYLLLMEIVSYSVAFHLLEWSPIMTPPTKETLENLNTLSN